MTGRPPRPPRCLWPAARAVWWNVHRHAAKRRLWRPEYRFGLEILAQTVALYLKLREDLRRLPAGAEAAVGLREHAEERRRLCRSSMVEWGLVPVAREAIGPVEANGDDLEIHRLAAPVQREVYRPKLGRGGDEAA